MVLRIGYIKVPGRIQRNTPWIAELSGFSARSTDDFDRAIIGIKDLDPAIPELANILASGSVDANIIRVAQLAPARACFSISAKELAVARENLNAVITRISNIKSVL